MEGIVRIWHVPPTLTAWPARWSRRRHVDLCRTQTALCC
jgi:hypothetical protein